MKYIFIKNKNIKIQTSGFTLIELLLYMGLFSILTTITFQLFATIFEAETEAEAVSSVTSDSKFIMNRFTYDINRSTSVTAPVVLGTQSTSLTMVINSQNLRYSLDSGNLILDNLTAGTSDNLNSNETTVSNLSFIRLDGGGNDAVQITFTLSSVATQNSGKEIKTYTISGGIR